MRYQRNRSDRRYWKCDPRQHANNIPEPIATFGLLPLNRSLRFEVGGETLGLKHLTEHPQAIAADDIACRSERMDAPPLAVPQGDVSVVTGAATAGELSQFVLTEWARRHDCLVRSPRLTHEAILVASRKMKDAPSLLTVSAKTPGTNAASASRFDHVLPDLRENHVRWA